MSLRLYERTVKEMPSRADIYFEKKFLFDRDKPLTVKADLVKNLNHVISIKQHFLEKKLLF